MGRAKPTTVVSFAVCVLLGDFLYSCVYWDYRCWLWTGCLLALWSQRTKTLPNQLQPSATSEDCRRAPMTTWCSWPVSSQPPPTLLSGPSSCPLSLMSPGASEASSPASRSRLPPVNWLAVSYFLSLEAAPSARSAWLWHRFTSPGISTLLLPALWIWIQSAWPAFVIYEKENWNFTSETHLIDVLGFIF